MALLKYAFLFILASNACAIYAQDDKRKAEEELNNPPKKPRLLTSSDSPIVSTPIHNFRENPENMIVEENLTPNSNMSALKGERAKGQVVLKNGLVIEGFGYNLSIPLPLEVFLLIINPLSNENIVNISQACKA